MIDPFLDHSLFRADIEVQRDNILAEEPAMHRDGIHSAMGTSFRGCGPLVIIFDSCRKNYSEYNKFDLILTNRSPLPVRLSLKLFHGPVVPGEEPPPFSVSGGTNIVEPNVATRLTFHEGDFGTYGGTRNFEEIYRFQFHVDFPPWESCRDEVLLDIKSFEGVRTSTNEGPRLTACGLSHVMPSYGEVIHRMRKPLIATKGLEVPPPHAFPKESCASNLSGFVMGVHLPEIDWYADPFKALEWTHFLNRFHFIRGLVLKCFETGDSEAADRIVYLIKDWIIKNPVPLDSDGGAGPVWETLTAAWRLIEWLPTISGLWSQSKLDEETKTLCLKSIWEHAQHLKSHQGHPNNWRIVESCALILAGLYFPEFQESDSWIETGSERLRLEIDRQYYPDGVQYEISPLYNAICLENLLRVFDGLKHVGKASPDYLIQAIRNGAHYLTSISRPDFTWPSINDSSSSNQNYCALLAYSADLISDPQAEWVGSRGERGLPPDKNLNVFPHSGLVVMREGWFPEANYMMFRAGPPGAFHIHHDNLSLEIFSRGKLRFPDPGISTYAPDAISEFYRSAYGHNMVLVQGQGPQRKRSYDVTQKNASGLHLTHHGAGMLMVSGSYDGEWGSGGISFNHERSIAFIDGCFWVIRDLLFGNDTAEISICWQCAPGHIEHDLDSWGFFFEDVQSPSIGIIPELGGVSPEIEVYTGCSRSARGWISVNGSDVPATTIVYNFSATKCLVAYWLILPVNGKFPARNNDYGITRKDGYVEIRLPNLKYRIDFDNREILAIDQ